MTPPSDSHKLSSCRRPTPNQKLMERGAISHMDADLRPRKTRPRRWEKATATPAAGRALQLPLGL